MCESCNEIPDIKLSITGITNENRKEKLLKAINAISKGLKVKVKKNSQVAEWDRTPKPQKSLHEIYKVKQMKILHKVINGVMLWVRGDVKKSIQTDPFRIKSKVVYKTDGKLMTVQDWDDIRNSISKYLKEYFIENGISLAEESAVLEGILLKMEQEGTDPNNVDLNSLGERDNFKKWLKENTLNQENYIGLYGSFNDTAQYCTGMSDRVKGDIVNVLRDGLRNGKTEGEIKQDLMYKMDSKSSTKDWNKDWDRLAKTEISTVRSDMRMAESIDTTYDGLPVYMKGVGLASACPICRRDIIGKIIRVLPSAPSKGFKDEYGYEVSWVGRRAVGVSNKESVAVIPRHPHCACDWITYVPDELMDNF